MTNIRDINWKGPIAVGVGVFILTTCLNRGGDLAVEAVKTNAWDDEIEAAVEPIKKVVEPMAKSTQSLAIDRKRAQITKKQEIYAMAPASDVALRQMLTEDVKGLQAEVAELEEIQKLPIFIEVE